MLRHPEMPGQRKEARRTVGITAPTGPVRGFLGLVRGLVRARPWAGPCPSVGLSVPVRARPCPSVAGSATVGGPLGPRNPAPTDLARRRLALVVPGVLGPGHPSSNDAALSVSEVIHCREIRMSGWCPPPGPLPPTSMSGEGARVRMERPADQFTHLPPISLNLTQYSYRCRSRASRDDYVSTYETKHP